MSLAVYVGFRLSELGLYTLTWTSVGFGLGMVVSARAFRRRGVR